MDGKSWIFYLIYDTIYQINFQLTYFMATVKQGVKLCKLGLQKLNNCIYRGEKDQKKYKGQSTLRAQGLGKTDQIQGILKFNTHTATDAFTLQNHKLFFWIFISDVVNILKHKIDNQHPPMVKDQKSFFNTIR